MELSKPGEIQNFCRPNGLLTFAEYLEDFASPALYEKGYKVIEYYANKVNPAIAGKTREYLQEIKKGKRDLYF